MKKLRETVKNAAIPFRHKSLPFWCSGFLVLALQSCFSDVEIPLPDVPPKLVLSSFISPEAEEVQVSVSKTNPLLSPGYGPTYNLVTDAVVWFSDGTDSVQLTLDFNNLYTTRALPVLPGRRYTLGVTAPGGLEARAACTVPIKLNQSLTIRIDSSEFGPGSDEGNYTAEFSWRDLPGEGDFYRNDGALVLEEPGFPGPERKEPLDMFQVPYLRDYQADGRNWKVFSGSISSYREYQRQGRLKAVEGYLFTTDHAYYEYHRSLQRFQNSDNFLDPVKIFTNVKGGLGIFAAYRSYKVTLPLK